MMFRILTKFKEGPNKVRSHITVACVLIVLILGSSTITSQEDDTGYVSWNPDGTRIAIMTDTRLDIINSTTLEIVSSFFPIKSYSTEANWNFDGTLIGFRNDSYFERVAPCRGPHLRVRVHVGEQGVQVPGVLAQVEGRARAALPRAGAETAAGEGPRLDARGLRR